MKLEQLRYIAEQNGWEEYKFSPDNVVIGFKKEIIIHKGFFERMFGKDKGKRASIKFIVWYTTGSCRFIATGGYQVNEIFSKLDSNKIEGILVNPLSLRAK